MLEGTTIR